MTKIDITPLEKQSTEIARLRAALLEILRDSTSHNHALTIAREAYRGTE